MRNAPKWRAFLPTGREIRRSLLRTFATALPSTGMKANLYMRPCDWSSTRSRHVASLEKRSTQNLTDAEVEAYSDLFSIERRDCAGVVHADSIWRYDVDEFQDAVVLGNTGQAASPGAGCAITEITKDTSKVCNLAVRRIPNASVNFLHHRDGVSNYYHYIAERCAIMLDVLTRLSETEPALSILTRREMSEIERTFLDGVLKEFPGTTLVQIASDEKAECERLLQHRLSKSCAFRSPYSSEAVEGVADLFRQAYGIAPPRKAGKRLLVSRLDARIRRLLNEEALFSLLKPYGFERICPGQLSHAEQVRIFGEAEFIVGAHGAGLTNIMFMPSQAAVVEIFSQDYCQGAYMWLSRLRSIDYTPIVCGPMKAHQNFAIGTDGLDSVLALVDGRLGA